VIETTARKIPRTVLLIFIKGISSKKLFIEYNRDTVAVVF